MEVDKMLLLDSGAQYEDGTTDVTRTMHFGNPSDFQRRTFTRVLQVRHHTREQEQHEHTAYEHDFQKHPHLSCA